MCVSLESASGRALVEQSLTIGICKGAWSMIQTVG